jgi:protein associated with RNAse G/E
VKDQDEIKSKNKDINQFQSDVKHMHMPPSVLKQIEKNERIDTKLVRKMELNLMDPTN